MKFGGTSVADADAIRRVAAIVASASARESSAAAAGRRRLGAGRRHGSPARADRGSRAPARRARARTALPTLSRAPLRRGRAARCRRVRDRRRSPKSRRSSTTSRALLGALAVLRDASPRALDAIACDRRADRAAGSSRPRWRTPGSPPPGSTRAARSSPTAPTPPPRPLATETREAVAREIVPARRRGARAGRSAASSARTAHGVTTTLGRGGSDYSAAIVGAALDAARDPDLDRRRRHADRRSARRAECRASCRTCRSPRRRSSRTSAPRCCIRARSCRRSAKDIPVRILNSRRAGRDRHADHRRAAAGRSAARRARLQARRHRRRHHVDAHADGARLPAARVRGVRALPHGGRRRDDVRGQRLGDDRRRPRGSTTSSAALREFAEVSVEERDGDSVRRRRQAATRSAHRRPGRRRARAAFRCGWCRRRRRAGT